MWQIVWYECRKESSYSVCRLRRPDSSSYAAKKLNDSLKEAISVHTEHLSQDNYCKVVVWDNTVMCYPQGAAFSEV